MDNECHDSGNQQSSGTGRSEPTSMLTFKRQLKLQEGSVLICRVEGCAPFAKCGHDGAWPSKQDATCRKIG